MKTREEGTEMGTDDTMTIVMKTGAEDVTGRERTTFSTKADVGVAVAARVWTESAIKKDRRGGIRVEGGDPVLYTPSTSDHLRRRKKSRILHPRRGGNKRICILGDGIEACPRLVVLTG